MNIHTRYVANNSNRSVSKCHVPAVSKAATGTRDDGTMCWSVTQSLLCTPVTYYMDRTPVSTGQEIRLKLWNPKVRHPDHNIPPLVPVLRQVNPVHGLPSYFVNANCNIILSSTLKSSKRFLALRSSIHSVACNLLSLSHDARPAHCVSCTLSPYWYLVLSYALTPHWPHTDPSLIPTLTPLWPLTDPHIDPSLAPHWPHTDPHTSPTQDAMVLFDCHFSCNPSNCSVSLQLSQYVTWWFTTYENAVPLHFAVDAVIYVVPNYEMSQTLSAFTLIHHETVQSGVCVCVCVLHKVPETNEQ